MRVVPAPSEQVLNVLAGSIALRHLEVIWTSDLDTDLARWVAFILAENYRDVAGVVIEANDRWPCEDALFIHVLDKEYLVEQVVQARGLENGGGGTI